MMELLHKFKHAKLLRWFTDPSVSWRMPLAIFILIFLTGFMGAAQTGLFDRDEPRNAQAAREMIETGNWLVPTFNGEPRLHKPILIYWLMALSYKLLGVTALAARMPSIIAGSLSGVVVYLFANKWFGRRVAIWSLIVWATVPLTLVESRMATTDAILNLLILGMMAMLARLYQGEGRWYARGFWLFLGLSILTKGPVGLLPVAGALIFTRYYAGVSLPWRFLRPLEGMTIACVVVLPWIVAVSLATDGEFLRFAVGREMLGRTIRPAEGHWGLPGYYLLMLPLMFFPWIAFLPMALKKSWCERKTDPRIAFLIGWAALPLVPLELMATKLVHYHYPSYAALAILVGREITRLEPLLLRPNLLEGGRFLRGSFISMCGLAAAFFLATAFVASWVVSIGSLLAASVLVYGLYRMIPLFQSGQWRKVIPVLAWTWVAVLILTLAWVLPAVKRRAITHNVAKSLKRHAEELQATAILGEFREPSLIFELQATEPVVISRKLSDLRTIARNKGALVVPVLEKDLAIMKKAGDLEVTVVDQVSAFDFQQGRRRKVGLALVTLRPEERLADLRELIDGQRSVIR